MKRNTIIGTISAAFLATVALASCAPTKTYHVKFTSENELVEEKDYKENEIIVAPKDPAPHEKDHKTYTFEAWYDGDFKFETGLKADKDYNFVAKFNAEDIVYTVKFVDHGSEVKQVTGKFGAPIEAPTDPEGYDDPTDYYHYDFDGWHDGETEFEEGVTTITGNQTFTSEYAKGDPTSYTATFHAKTGDVEVKFDVKNTTKTTPETGDTPSTGHTLYWLIGSDQVEPGADYDFEDCLGSEVDVYYDDIPNPHTVTLKVNGVETDVIESAYGEDVLSEDVPTEKDYYEKIGGDDHYYHHFTGKWAKTDGGNEYYATTDTVGDADMEIYADFQKDEADPIIYEIKFYNTDGKTQIGETQEIHCSDGQEEVLTADAPKISEDEVTGHTWKWVTEGGACGSEETITFADEDANEGLTLPIASYDFVLTSIANKYTITYDVKGGTLPGETTQSITFGGEYELEIPTNSNTDLTFNGWYAPNGQLVNSTGIWLIANDVTLTAVWSVSLENSDSELPSVITNFSAGIPATLSVDTTGENATQGKNSLKITGSTSLRPLLSMTYLESIFDDTSVSSVAFDMKSDATNVQNNLEIDYVKNGTRTRLSPAAKVEGDHAMYGLRERWKTFYLERSTYNAIVADSGESCMLYADMASATNVAYIDNIRPNYHSTATHADFEGGEIRSDNLNIYSRNATAGKTVWCPPAASVTTGTVAWNIDDSWSSTGMHSLKMIDTPNDPKSGCYVAFWISDEIYNNLTNAGVAFEFRTDHYIGDGALQYGNNDAAPYSHLEAGTVTTIVVPKSKIGATAGDHRFFIANGNASKQIAGKSDDMTVFCFWLDNVRPAEEI